MPAFGPRLGARLLDLLIQVAIAVVTLLAVGDGRRPFAAALLGAGSSFLYELLTVRSFGKTAGMAAAGLAVTPLDRAGPVPWAAAARRAAFNATMLWVPVVGWAAWIVSTATAPAGRGPADRMADTMLINKGALVPIRTRDLPGFVDGHKPPRLVTLGRVADADVRARARLRRLDDAPLLAVVIGLLALSISLPVSTAAAIVGASAAWLVAFVVDETLRIRRQGTTAGHRLAGLVIVSRKTGRPPGGWRSFCRALVLGLTLYLPVLWPLLFISWLMMAVGETGRSLHDLAGGTVVISDPTLDPEEQRQRAMRMRLGRAG